MVFRVILIFAASRQTYKNAEKKNFTNPPPNAQNQRRQMALLDKSYIFGMPDNLMLKEDWSWISGGFD